MIPDLAYDVAGRVFLRAEGLGSNTSLRNGSAPTAPSLDGTDSGQYDTRGGNNIFQLGMDGGGVQNINLPVGAAITSQQVVDSINGVFPGRAQLINRAQASEIQSNQAGPFDIRAGVNDTLNLEVNESTVPSSFRTPALWMLQMRVPTRYSPASTIPFATSIRATCECLASLQAFISRVNFEIKSTHWMRVLASVAGGALRLQPAAGSAVQVRNET